jgi:hypothetical protein
MSELSQNAARMMIERLGGPGQPPEYGLRYITAGLDPYLSVLDEEYLKTFIPAGGSAFKMVVGIYGGGKTHFLYCVRDLAWSHGFAVSYVGLTPGESPFHQLELVYKAIVRGIMPPVTQDELLRGYETGIASFLRAWYAQVLWKYRKQGLPQEQVRDELLGELARLSGIESLSFASAVKAAFRALMDQQDEEFISVCQWLSGEGYDRRAHARHGILQRIDRTTAFTMLRSLVQWVRQVGYSGLVVLLDEAERVASLSAKQTELHLSNLREIIDECGHTNFQRVMILYAVPDRGFLNGKTQVYEALKQRVSTIFDLMNPAGVQIELERVITEPLIFLAEVGGKLARVYEIGYAHKFAPAALEETVRVVAENAYAERFSDIGYKRLFVQALVPALNVLRHTGVLPAATDVRK